MHKRPTFSRLLLLLSSIATSLFLFVPRDAAGQAAAAAQKKGDLSTYVMYTHVWPSWLGTKETNNGVTFGLEYLRHVGLPVAPSAMLRGKIAPGNFVGERTFGGGLKVEPEQPLGAFRPYVDFLVSSGTISFTHPGLDYRGLPYRSDNSIVYSAGGGVDIDITARFTGRIDYQYEWWSIGTNQNFTPSALGLGIVYRIPFHPF